MIDFDRPEMAEVGHKLGILCISLNGFLSDIISCVHIASHKHIPSFFISLARGIAADFGKSCPSVAVGVRAPAHDGLAALGN